MIKEYILCTIWTLIYITEICIDKIIAVLVFFFLLFPLVIITVTAFNGGESIVFPIQSFSLRWFQTVLMDE